MYLFTDMNKFLIRAIAGTIYAALWLSGSLFFPPLLNTMLLAFIPLAMNELFMLSGVKQSHLQFSLIAMGWLLALLLFVQAFDLDVTSSFHSIYIILLMVVVFITQWIVAVFSHQPVRQYFLAVSGSFVYILLPIISIYLLQQIPFNKNISWLPVILGLIWINDTMAYITGSLLGKHKLIERVSPGKTIEGFIGGVVFTLIAVFVVGLIFKAQITPVFYLIAIVVTIAGTLGDLLESKLKREAGVKDSGHLMPGHGGILDRLDSLLIAAPVAFVLIIIFIET